MKTLDEFTEIISGSQLLDAEMNELRGGINDNQVVARCDIGRKGDIECDTGRIEADDLQLEAC